MPESRDTIFAVASGRPPAAVSIVRISGPSAHGAGERLSGSLPPPRLASVRRLLAPDTGELLDEALMLRFDAPASATGEDTIELHCHGGRAVVEAVLGALATLPDLRRAEPGEFTRRAFENGRIDLTQAEGIADLIEAETEAQRRAALQLAGGTLRSQVEQWREQVVALSARAEQAIDYAEEDGAGDSPSLERQLREDTAAFAADLDHWLARPRAEPLKDGLRVVIAGPPNAGKSSLLNALVGYQRAIVSATPGTTRDHIEVPIAVGGVAILLTDTAGLRTATDDIEAAGVERAEGLAHAADLVIWLGDLPPPAFNRLIMVHAKCDLPARSHGPAGRLPVSAVTGDGVGPLLAAVAQEIRSLIPAPGSVALNRRHAALIENAAGAISEALQSADLAVLADGLRRALEQFDGIAGRAAVEDMLDALFSRFCLGK